MKKLFIPLLITMTGLAVNSALAQSTATITKPSSSGFVTVNGQSGTALDAATTESYLKDICGATKSTWSGNWSVSSTAPQNGTDAVYFVEVNDYWIGKNSGSYSLYTQIEKGVKKITAVNSDASQKTSSGTFYTHPATGVNKFFFIKRKSSRKSSSNLAFAWYDEWSYVSNSEVNGSQGYNVLQPTWEKLMDGTPFPSPHNCDTSLETNHYIALDGKHPLDSKGHDFTAYLYIPSSCAKGSVPSTTKVEQVGTGKFVNDDTTYYIFDSDGSSWLNPTPTRSSTNDLTYVYTEVNGVEKPIAEVYPDKYYSKSETSRTSVVSTKIEIVENQVSGECPYVFFYAVDLQDVPEKHVTIKTSELAEGESKYQVELHWNTAFDKFANHGVQKYAEYDGNGNASKGMQEHYVIQRSYDNDEWETVDAKLIVSGNNVKDAANKTIIDKGLKDKDSEFGFTVWYRVTSIVEKSDGTKMSETKSNVVRVEIPGTVPFKLTLAGGGTSKYDPVSVKNTFTNTIISSYSKVEYETIVKAGSTLSLYRVDADGKIIEDDESPLITVTAEGGETLADLAKQIKSEGNPEGKYTDECTLPAGDENEAAYQLVMKIPANDENSTATYLYSNILRISNPAIANASIAAHRSGYPDAETCQNGNPEIFHNEITFKASANRVGTGYYIYRDKKADPIMTLVFNGEDGFRVVNSAENTSYKSYTGGYITIIDIVDTAPIAEGEGVESVKSGESVKSANKVAWSYAVAYSDNIGGNENNENTYGSLAKPAVYEGTNGELVLRVEADVKAANFSQPGNNKIYTVVTINWNRTKEYDDTKPSFYEIYLKKNGNDRTDITDPKFEKIPGQFGPEEGSYTFTETYESVWQSEHGKYDKNEATKAEFANSLKDAYEVYVKMITTENKEKNSFIAIPVPNAGAIYTGIEGVEAQEMDVKVVNGVVEVNGVYGMIKVIDAKGAVAAEAVGTGDVTEIEGLGTGVYVVTAKDMKPTKILIK